MKAMFILLFAITVAGCASGGRCVGEQDYQQAHNLPPPPAVDGIKPAPDSGSALRIPAEPADKTPFAQTIEDPANPAETRMRCLDTPPRMEVPPAEPAPTAS